MEQITKYFNAEKAESVLFVLVGFTAILVSVFFLFKARQPFTNGMSYPLIAIALIQITVGSSVYYRSPKDIERVSRLIKTEKQKIQSEEIPRMEIVMKNFSIYKWTEIILMVVGVILFLGFKQNDFLKGIGIGLLIQAGFMLMLDFFAESRGKVYLEYLQNIV